MKNWSFGARLSVLSLALVGALPSMAQTQLKEVVVTATRRPMTAEDTFQSISVINRQKIEESGAQSVMDLLAGLPGVSVVRNGGMGKTTSVLLRGSNSNQVLVLVNGVRASAASNAEFDWNSIHPEQVERIELVRGPLASLYGSDAIAGVIQIFTRSPAQGFSFSQTLGSYGTQETEVGFGGGDDWRYGVNLGTSTTEGIQTLIKSPSRFGFRQEHVDMSLAGHLTESVRLSVGSSNSQGRNSLETATGSGDFVNQISYLKLEQQVSNNWSQSVNLGYAFNSLDVRGGFTPGKLDTTRQSMAWQNQINMGEGQLTLGLDRWIDRAVKVDYSNSSANLDKNLSTTGIFAQYALSALDLDWQLGARNDKHNVYGSQSTYNAAVGQKLESGWAWSLSHGTAFKAPTANDLFWPHNSYPNTDWTTGVPLTFPASCGPALQTHCQIDEAGNPNVKPESSKTTELGLRYSDGFSVSANLFETQVKDLIQWDSSFAGSGAGYTQYWYPNNVKLARIQGLELSYSHKVQGWMIDAQLTRLLATDLDRGEQLDRRPKNSASVSVGRAIANFKAGLELLLASERLDNTGSSYLPGYGVVNLKTTYALNRDWALQARVENILDKRYALATLAGDSYATPGTSAYVTLRYVQH